MKIRPMVSSVIALMLSAGTALPAAALSVSVGHAGAVDGSVSGAGVNVDAQSSTSVDLSHDQHEADAADTNAIVLFNRADIDAADDTNASTSNHLDINFGGTAASVATGADLSAFVATQMKHDDNLAQVQASADSVAVTYKDEGKFLGIIPATVYATAIVDGSGNVTVSYPWYGFLFSTPNKAALQSTIEAQVKSDVHGSSTLSAAEQAKLVADIHAAMEAHTAAGANVQ